MLRRLKNYLAIIPAVLFGLVPSATEATAKLDSPNILFVVADDLRWSDVDWHDGGTRVCAFANWPRKLKPQKLTVPMHTVDWMPTIAALLGYTSRVDLQWDGVNQWPVLTGAATPSLPRTIYIAAKGGHSIRSGEWKLIVPANGKAQLFHIGNDPYEKSDVVDSMPDIVTDLRNRLAAHQEKTSLIFHRILSGYRSERRRTSTVKPSHDQRDILAAKTKAVGNRPIERRLTSLVGHVVEVAVGVRLLVVNRRGQHTIPDRQ